MIKIIFFDVDGTIISTINKKITPLMVETLKTLQQKRIKIGLATGRGPHELPHIPDIKFDAYVTFNGAYVYAGKKIIKKTPLTKDDVYKIIENAKKINRPVCASSKFRLVANGADQDLIDYFAIVKKPVPVADDFNEYVKRHDIYQIMMGYRKDEVPQILKDTKETKIAAWWPRATDIVSASSGKGNGILSFIKSLGYSKEEVMVFGDGENDLDMIDKIPHSVAMGNASNVVKSHAKYVCLSVEEEGIYHYLKNLKII